MRRIILPYVSLGYLPKVSPHYLINGTIFGKKLLNTKCVIWFSLQLLFETFLILRRNERHIINVRVYWSSCKAPSVLVILQRKLNFLRRFLKKKTTNTFHEKTSSRSQILPCGQTDLTKLTIAFPNFTNATKKKLVKVNEEIKAINKCLGEQAGCLKRSKRHDSKQSALLISKNKPTYRTPRKLNNVPWHVTIFNWCSYWFAL